MDMRTLVKQKHEAIALEQDNARRAHELKVKQGLERFEKAKEEASEFVALLREAGIEVDDERQDYQNVAGRYRFQYPFTNASRPVYMQFRIALDEPLPYRVDTSCDIYYFGGSCLHADEAGKGFTTFSDAVTHALEIPASRNDLTKEYKAFFKGGE